MDASKSFDAARSETSPSEKQASYAFVGSLAGPAVGLLFTFARIGPAGIIWWQGKGGETILTPTGRIIVCIVIVAGAFAGALCGWAFDARYRPDIAAVKPKRHAPQAHLWDRDLDG